MANARAKAESAEEAADRSLKDSELARIKAKEFAPEFVQPGTDPNWPRVPDHHLTNHHDKIQPQSSRSLTRSPYESPPARGGDSYGPPGRSKVGANSPMSALVSSTMDCVIGPSTTQVAGNLRRLEDNKGFNNHQRYPEEAEPFVDRYASPPPPPSSADYARSNHVQPVHAEEAYSRVPDPRDRADRAFAWQQQHQQPQQQQDHRRGGGYDPGGHDPRYRKPVDPYDPYSRTKRDDSGLGPEMEYPSPGDHRQPVYAVPHPRNQLHSPAGHGHGPPPMGGGYSGAHTLDRSPDSGMSDSEDFRHISRPLVRRKTLPSIMAEPVRTTPNATSPNNALSAPPGAEPPPTQSPDLYVIENGIRKRIKAEVHARPVRPGADRPNDVMPNRLKLERMVSRGAKGSLPDVSAVSDREVMPREVVAHLSQKRRAEMLAMNDEEARRKQQEIVLRLTDLKDWCKQRQLMMLVIAVNVSLATMFFNLLSQ